MLILILNRKTSRLNKWIWKKTKGKVKVTGIVILIVAIYSHSLVVIIWTCYYQEMLAKLTKKMETQEQKSASLSSCSNEALGQKEVRWSHLVGNGTGQNVLPTLQIFFICFSHMLWRNMSELWWRSPSWKWSKRSWGRRSTLRVRRSTRESSSHSLLLHHWTLLEGHLQNSDSCFWVLFRLESRLREEGEELFKVNHRFQLLQVNPTFLCAINLLWLLK